MQWLIWFHEYIIGFKFGELEVLTLTLVLANLSHALEVTGLYKQDKQNAFLYVTCNNGITSFENSLHLSYTPLLW